MDDLPIKSKKRAMRRKRNLIARDMKLNKIYHEKIVPIKGMGKHPTKRKRPQKLRPNDIDIYLEDEIERAP